MADVHVPNLFLQFLLETFDDRFVFGVVRDVVDFVGIGLTVEKFGWVTCYLEVSVRSVRMP